LPEAGLQVRGDHSSIVEPNFEQRLGKDLDDCSYERLVHVVAHVCAFDDELCAFGVELCAFDDELVW